MDIILIGILAVFVVASIGVSWFKVYKPLKLWKYNLRQLSIYSRTTELIFRAADANDIPMAEVVAALNAAVDTYNESLRGKNIETLHAKYFPLVRDTNEIGRQDNPEGEKPQGEE